MTTPQLLQLVLIFALVGWSRCCMLSRSLECPMSGASFGGRLLLLNGRGPHTAVFSRMVDRGKKIIFEMPPAHIRSHIGFGRGRIWIGSKTCLGSGSQPGHCPWTEDRPCLSLGAPCETELLSYTPSNRLEFSAVTVDSITVPWPAWLQTTGIRQATGCTIRYRLPGETFEEVRLNGDSFPYQVDNLRCGTTYQFQVVPLRNEYPIEGQQGQIQNVTTKPCPAPRRVRVRNVAENRNYVTFKWHAVPYDYGEIRYKIVAIVNGEKRPPKWKKSTLFHLRPLSKGDTYLFRVRACYDDVCGPYAEADGVM